MENFAYVNDFFQKYLCFDSNVKFLVVQSLQRKATETIFFQFLRLNNSENTGLVSPIRDSIEKLFPKEEHSVKQWKSAGLHHIQENPRNSKVLLMTCVLGNRISVSR